MNSVQVFVHEVWDRIELPFVATESIGTLKRQALEIARVPIDPAEFVVKFRGAAIFDENMTLEAAGVIPGSSLIALRSRRAAVQ